jgi:hypothetical protein
VTGCRARRRYLARRACRSARPEARPVRHVRIAAVQWSAMKKLLVLIVVVALAAFAVKKLQDA